MAERSALYPGPGMIADYHDWFDGASHGDVLIYYTGDLQYDRQAVYDESKTEEKADWAKTITLNAVADSIAYEAKRGNLILTQRRLGESNYEYRASRVRLNDAARRQANQQSDAERIFD